MRCVFSFQIEKFPLFYRLLLLSYIKGVIRSQSDEFYQSFFIDRARETKEFSFASYFRNIQIEKNIIRANSLELTVSSSNIEFMIFLINGAQQKKEYRYKGASMVYTGVKMVKEKTINQSQVWMKTLSPILVETKEKKPLLANDENFEKELNIICSKITKSNYDRPLYQPIKILKHNLKKSVVKENFHQKAGVLFFTVNKGEFLLEGDPKDLTLIYQNGFLSLRSNQGFGCLDIL